MPLMTKEEHDAYLASLPDCHICGKRLSFFRMFNGKPFCPYCGGPNESEAKQFFQTEGIMRTAGSSHNLTEENGKK